MLVTNNALGFRGRYREIEMHPGVVFLLPSVRRADQIRLFEAAIHEILARLDVVNSAVDVCFGADRAVTVRIYDLP